MNRSEIITSLKGLIWDMGDREALNKSLFERDNREYYIETIFEAIDKLEDYK